MPPSITEPAAAFRRPDGTNRWWTEDEEKILVNRLLRDDPTKGDLNNRTAVTLRGLWGALSDFDLWPIFIVRPPRRSPPPLPFFFLIYFVLIFAGLSWI